MKQPFRTLLLAAGLGTRLRPITLANAKMLGDYRRGATCWAAGSDSLNRQAVRQC